MGLTQNEFKIHNLSFKLKHRRTSTTLSDLVGKMQNKNIDFSITREVVKEKNSPYLGIDRH